MDCKLCNPKSDDWNICQTCSHELNPFIYYMGEITGDSGWMNFDAVLFPCDKDHIRIIRAFFCGQQANFDVTDEGMIIRIEMPIYRPLTMGEQSKNNQAAS